MEKSKFSMMSMLKREKSELSMGHNSSTVGMTTVTSMHRRIQDHDLKSARAVNRLKMAILTFFTLTAVGVTAAFCVYSHYNKIKQQTEFKNRFKQDATNMLASLGISIDSTMAAADAFAMSMLAEAKATNQTYPFVTIKDWAVQSSKLRKNSNAKWITTYQLVEESQRKEWEEYTSTHNEWIQEGIDVQSRDKSYSGPPITEKYIEENYMGNYDLIHGYDEFFFECDNSTDGVNHPGPYLPNWQQTPVVPTYPLYNWDLTTAAFKPPWFAVYQTHLVTISEPYMIAWPWDKEKQAENEAEAEWIQVLLEPGEEPLEPISDIYYPMIVEALDNVYHREDTSAENYSTGNNTLGAYLALTIYWRDHLRDLLPTGSAGVTVNFENECAIPFTYEITGPVAKYLGTGYFNSTYEGDEDLKIELDLMEVWSYGIKNTTYTGIPINQDVCPFKLKIYPAETSFELLKASADNTVYVVLVLVLSVAVLTIAFTLLFFFLYDRLVRNEITSKIGLLDAKRNFVRFVSHEVRTPLNTVCMGLTLMHQDLKMSEKKKLLESDDESESEVILVTKKDLEKWSTLTGEVRDNAEVAVGVLNDLLNIDKIQMGAFKLEMEVLPIWEVIEQTTMEFKMMAVKQNTVLKLDLSCLVEKNDTETAIPSTYSKLPPSVLLQRLVGDSQRIRQVLRNLLSNAIKFSKNRSVTVKVSTRDGTNDGQGVKEIKLSDDKIANLAMSGRVAIDVNDTGVGMTPLQLKTVFDLGTQFNANKLQSGGGSGLGMAFAKAIAEQHGGSLRAYSDGRDKGTTFRLDLPLYKDGEGPKLSLSNKNHASIEESTSKHMSIKEETLEPMHILVVDDAPLNRKLLIRLLQSNGHTCGQAENGQVLINTIQDSIEKSAALIEGEKSVQFDCVLVDYEMPVMNGPDACKAIRQMGYTGFVVGVTGNLLPEDVGYFLDCGADAVLGKPFKYNELEQLLMEQGLFAV